MLKMKKQKNYYKKTKKTMEPTTFFSDELVRTIMGAIFILLLYLFFTGSQKTKQWCMAIVIFIAVGCLILLALYPPIPNMSYGELMGGMGLELIRLLLVGLIITAIGAGIFLIGRICYRRYLRKKIKKLHGNVFIS